MIMFLISFSRVVKSTRINAASGLCFDFYKKVGVMKKESTFLFTAYTGSLFTAFGGLTICSGVFEVPKPARY